MEDFLIGDVIEVKWHEFDATPEVGVFSGTERGYYLLTTATGNIVPFLINNVIIKKLDKMPVTPLPVHIFWENIKENRNICMIFFVTGMFISLIIEQLFLW